MKKIFTLVFCVLAAFTANAQVEILDNDKTVANGSTFEVLGHSDNFGTEEEPFYMVSFEHDPFIINKGNSKTNVTVTVTKTNADDILSWCYGGTCLPFSGTSLTQKITLNAGQKESLQLHPDEFSIDATQARTISVKLEVSANGKKENYTINYVYNPNATGIESTQADRVAVANKQLSYNFSNNADRQLNVYGVSGRLVKSEALSQNGVVALTDLHRGVYIYEITANGKRTSTHKFVIK